MGRRVTTPSMVVPLEPVANVVGDADVVARGIGGTSDDVDDSLFNSIHASPTGMDQASAKLSNLSDRALLYAGSAISNQR